MPRTHKISRKSILFRLFGLTNMLLIFVGGNVYLSAQFEWFFRTGSTIYFNILFAFIVILIFYAIGWLRNKDSNFGTFVYSLATILMGVMLFLLLSVAIVDLLHIFIKIPVIYYGIISISLTLFLSTYGTLNASNIRITNYEIDLNNITKPLKIAQLSDIHIGHFRGKKFFQKTIDKTIALNPDLVAITGDLYDGEKYFSKEFLEPLTQIKTPMFFIEGNHDLHAGIDALKKVLCELNVKVLDNEIYEFGEIELIGLKYMKSDTKSFDMLANEQKETIKSVLLPMQLSETKPKILLHHSPSGIKFAVQKKIDVYLAGHTHAGQVFPMTIFNRLVFGYNRGFHNINGLNLIISEGIGSSRPPMRIGTKSEIVVVTMNPKN